LQVNPVSASPLAAAAAGLIPKYRHLHYLICASALVQVMMFEKEHLWLFNVQGAQLCGRTHYFCLQCEPQSLCISVSVNRMILCKR